MKKDDIFVTNSSHQYLFGIRGESNEYISAAKIAIETLAPFLTRQQLKKLKSDFQFYTSSFDEEKYLQAACETVVTASLAAMFPAGYCYEPKVNGVNNENCECSFVIDGCQFNVEVKCINFKEQKSIDAAGQLKISNPDNSVESRNKVAEIVDILGADFVRVNDYMGYKLRDYLVSSNGKFGDRLCLETLNVLVVCAGGTQNIQDLSGYLFGKSGLFTEGSFHPVHEYKNVDVLVISNLYHRHCEYWEHIHLTGLWSLEKAFNLCIPVPWVNQGKRHTFEIFIDNFPNLNNEYEEFCMRYDGGITRLIAPHIFPINRFVSDVLLPEGRFYFEP